MPVTRSWINQDTDACQVLAIEDLHRFVVVDACNDWQALFGPSSTLSPSTRLLKLAAEYDAESFDRIRLAAYLYNTDTAAVDALATCTFRLYIVGRPGWVEVLSQTVAGTLQSGNHYFFAEVLLSALTPTELDGNPTIMVEAFATRQTRTFRDRVYVNHLGSYDSIVRLRNRVDFLEITKLDE